MGLQEGPGSYACSAYRRVSVVDKILELAKTIPPLEEFHFKMNSRSFYKLRDRLTPVIGVAFGGVDILIDESTPDGVAEKHEGPAPREALDDMGAGQAASNLVTMRNSGKPRA